MLAGACTGHSGKKQVLTTCTAQSCFLCCCRCCYHCRGCCCSRIAPIGIALLLLPLLLLLLPSLLPRLLLVILGRVLRWLSRENWRRSWCPRCCCSLRPACGCAQQPGVLAAKLQLQHLLPRKLPGLYQLARDHLICGGKQMGSTQSAGAAEQNGGCDGSNAEANWNCLVPGVCVCRCMGHRMGAVGQDGCEHPPVAGGSGGGARPPIAAIQKGCPSLCSEYVPRGSPTRV